MIGTVLSGYHVVAKIKDGSVGTVWKGRNPFNEDVAIKMLSAQHARESRKIKEFRNEAKIAGQLKHPGIIRIVKFADVSPQPYVIMEYFSSENLKFALMNMPERIRGKEFRILRQICDALHAMHQLGIVHLDMKPENVLVSETSEVRLIDFSIAQSTWGRMLKFGKTKWGGTPAYMAPEQIRGDAVSPATDQYAFGVLAYELFARRAPFLATNQNGLLEKHLSEAPPPLRKVLPKTPPDVDRVILRMLEKNPANRWPDMPTVSYELGKLAEKWGVWWVDSASGATAKTTAHTARMLQPTSPPKGAPAKVPARGEDVSLLKTHPIPTTSMPRPGETARMAGATDRDAAPARPVAPVPPREAVVERAPAEPVSGTASSSPDAPGLSPAFVAPPAAADPKPAALPADAPDAKTAGAAVAPSPVGPVPPAAAGEQAETVAGRDDASANAQIEILLEARLKRRLESERSRKQQRADAGSPSEPIPPRAPHESDVNLPSVR